MFNKISIVEWFDSKNTEHLKAYDHMTRTGRWPADVPPAGVYPPCGWEISIERKIPKNYKDIISES